jgi:hypothetical protein
VPLSLRVTPQLKARLDAAADETGRSQTQEIEFRLERSFDRQDLLLDVLANAFGPQTAELLVVLGRALRATEELTRSMVIRGGGSVATRGGGSVATRGGAMVNLGSAGSITVNTGAFSATPWAGDWLNDPAAHELAAKAVGFVLERFRPPSDKPPSAELAAALEVVGLENFSKHLADYVVAEDEKWRKRDER